MKPCWPTLRTSKKYYKSNEDLRSRFNEETGQIEVFAVKQIVEEVENDEFTIEPGPNNPVGTVWIDLSKEHYGIHGTPEPSRIGHTQSHGCVRLTNWDAATLLQWVRPGTAVVFR